MEHLIIGLGTAATPVNLLFCAIGVFLGMVVGVMPGIGALAAISLLFPFTFRLDPTTALIMLAGIYYGTAYGGSVTAILLNVPGSASSTVSCLDGYPMSRQGRAGVALFMTTVASFVGGCIGIIAVMAFAPVIVDFALQFGAAEYFSLMVLGLIAASAISDGSAIKAIAMVLVGILFGTVGLDLYTGLPRFDFGILELSEGIGLVAVAMGLFGVAEVVSSIRNTPRGEVLKVTLRSMMPSRDDVRRSWRPILRGTAIGSFFGALPGTGPTVASFMAYAFEKRVSSNPERFGKGAIEGVVSPEAANNAADQTAFLPTLTLGVPGSATMALMIGVLIIHGITPGPDFIVDRPDVFWGLVMSFWIGNLFLLVMNIPLIGVWVRVLQIPYHLLYPSILLFVCVGAYSVHNSIFDVWMTIAFGILGYVLRVLSFPAAPMLLGFVLGPMLEEHFRRSMIISRGNLLVFFERPISGTIMVIAIAVLLWGIWTAVRKRKPLVVVPDTATP